MGKPYLIPIEDGYGHPFEERKPYKIYHDGGHHIATLIVRRKGKLPPKKPANTAFDIAFDSLYFQAKKKGLKDEEMADFGDLSN